MLSSVCTEPVMPSDAANNPSPQPGEIWETDRGYVMIVRPQNSTFTVMGLSTEPSDAIIPAQISGLDQDLFADTTNIFRLSRQDLLRQRGDRLSRQRYDDLMTLGDNLEAQQWASIVLDRSLQVAQTLQQLNVTPLPRPRTIALSNWFNAQFEPAWVSLETLISSGQLRLTSPTRGPENDLPDLEELSGPNLICRARLLDLGSQVSGRTVALAIAIQPRDDQRFDILLRVYPTENEPYVPEDLKLVLLDQSGPTYEVVARPNDLYLQLKFSGNPGERFGVQVAFGEAQITEEFLL
ncbi:MAG: DUF1822 family protein [Alkalinema sp. RU_4_3]|nr:DUF1822 family protein [Alkalinema sp. RU_4_3]